MIDSLPIEFALPAAIVAAALYFVLEFRASRTTHSDGPNDRPGR
ncbi:hypothetical protein [Microbacterium sp. NPDC078849]